MKRFMALLMTAAILSLTSCARQESAQPKFTYQFYGVFGTTVQVTAYTTDSAQFNQMALKAQKRLEELSALFDARRDYDGVLNLKTVNGNAGECPVKAAPELLGLIKRCMDLQKQSPEVISIAVAEHPDIDQIQLNEAVGTVYLADGAMQLDVDAVATGYALQLVADELAADGWTKFMIRCGNTVCTVGSPIDGAQSKWEIAVPHYPAAGWLGRTAEHHAFLAGSSMSTCDKPILPLAGSTAGPDAAPGFRSVTVSAGDCALADYLSATLFLLPYDQGLSYLKSVGRAEALWVFADGTVKMTSGMRRMVK